MKNIKGFCKYIHMHMEFSWKKSVKNILWIDIVRIDNELEHKAQTMYNNI